MVSVATQRFLGTRTVHARTLQYLADDPVALVRWSATCHLARSEASEASDDLWSRVWDAVGSVEARPRRGGRTTRARPRPGSAKAGVLRAAAAAAAAAKAPCSLNERDCEFIIGYRRTTAPGSFPHVTIQRRIRYPDFTARHPAAHCMYLLTVPASVGATALDYHKIRLIQRQRELDRLRRNVRYLEQLAGSK